MGSEGVGSDIVNRYKTTKNGHACYTAFNAHFKNASFLENKASAATAAMGNAVYKGDRQHFTIETYYSIMSKAFNDLELAGSAHALSEQQKITKFEQGLKDNNAISWSITAKNVWNSLPVANQTFDAFYNKFSQYMTKFKTMSAQGNQTSRIAAFNTGRGGRGRSGRGRGGRGGRHGGRGRGRGRGRGNRSNNTYSPYSIASQYGNFQPQAKIYSDDEWAALSPHQKRMVQDLKGKDGWVNGQTPPPGCTIDQHGFATATTALVSAVQRSIAAASTSNANQIVPLPPPSPGTVMEPPPNRVPPVINTNASTAGSAFGRQGTRVNPQHDTSSVSQVSLVSINGQSYNGPVFDSNGTRIA